MMLVIVHRYLYFFIRCGGRGWLTAVQVVAFLLSVCDWRGWLTGDRGRYIGSRYTMTAEGRLVHQVIIA
jgi:hypothetical protein